MANLLDVAEDPAGGGQFSASIDWVGLKPADRSWELASVIRADALTYLVREQNSMTLPRTVVNKLKKT